MRDLEKIDGLQLSSLLGIHARPDDLWDREELKSIWRHQLAAPLDDAAQGQGSGAPGLPIVSFADLLRHPSPSVEMLRVMVRRSERWGRDPHQPLPAEIARMIGCAVGAAARVRCNEPVIPADQLAGELAWAVEQEWPDASTRLLLADALDRIAGGTADPSPPTPSIPGYEILGCLGQGGMGSVWRARQRGSGRDVAVKVLHASSVGSERARARFAREIELASSLNHPNIARVYDSQVGSHLCFYSMELIEGIPLDEYVASMYARRDQIVALVESVCRAVQHAHEQGVIHRDLKPSNILVDSSGQPHVLDFGLAKAAGPDAATLLLSMEGELAGTLGYMAPEQAMGAGGQADTRSDVYSLGAILYQLLLGRLPCDTSGQRWDVAHRIASGQIARPRMIDPSLDAELEAILVKSLSLERPSRYGSAGELASDLQRYRRGEPLAARPPTLGYFAGKWVQRRRVPLAIAAAVLVSLLGTAIMSYVRVAVARSEAVSAQHLEAQARQLAEQRRLAAEAARHEAVLNAGKADEMRRTAELRLAEGLVAQGDAMAQGNRWVEAKELYREAGSDFAKMGLSRMPADLGLLNAYRIAPPPLLELRGHRGPVMQTAFSPDGTLAASAGTDGMVCVWDLLRARLIYRLSGHTREVTCVAFSSDQRLLISGSNDLTARLWDLSTGTCIRQMKVGNELRSVTFSPRGTWCAVGTDFQPLMWEVATGKKVCLHGLEDRVVRAQRFSADERTCLVCGQHDHMELQDAASGRLLRSIHTGVVTYAAVYSHDGKLLLTGHSAGGGGDSTIRLWDPQTWQVIREFHGHSDAVTAVAFSPDETQVLAASDDGLVITWNISGGPPVKVAYGDGHPLRNASISRDCQLALTGGQDGVVRLWDLHGDRGMEALRAANGALSIATSADGRLAATAGPDGMSLFDIPARRELYHLPSERPRSLVAMSPDGRHAVADLWDEVRLLDVAKATETSLPRCGGIIRGAEFSRDGRLVAWGDGCTAYVADVKTLTIRSTIRPYMTMAESLAFSPDANLLLSATSHGTAYMWILPWGIQVPTLAWFQDRRELTSNVVYYNQLGTMAAGSGKKLLVWETFSGRLLAELEGHHSWISRIALSPDEHWVASSSWDGLVKVWDLRKLKEARTLDGHGGQAVRSLCWSANGNVLLSGGNDRRIAVWELDRPERYRRFATEVASAQATLTAKPNDPAALTTLGRWYAFRGHDDWAVQMFTRAHAAGGEVSPLLMARSLWRVCRTAEAAAEFERARQQASDPVESHYLELSRKSLAGDWSKN